ncbi:MAG TPA: ATP-binding protein, partial [Burkholderiaceae bacterium]|nr:ATP-binding protein [Burkholderiaceae bacterium]
DWLVIPLDQLAPPFPVPMAVIWLSAMGLLLLCSAGFSWHITRPLRHLANAADQLAAGKPERVNPSGPQETRSLAQRFNAMLDALAQEQAIRSTLLAGLPHDLKGPLSRMWLRTEMLDDDAVKKGLLDDIQDMQRMVNQFIEFVRGSDLSSYHFETMDLDEWLAEKIKTWQDTGSEIDLNRPATPLRLNADATALGRLLDNLITNALNHGKPPVNVTLEQHKNRAQISVSDHGSGIAAEQYNEALRPFSRLDEARTRTGSVGLGLALCQAIAEAHGGSLRLSTATSGGLNVIVSLPLDQINS